MSIRMVELKRRALGISKRRLCLAAAMPTSTYYRLLAKPGSGRMATAERLSLALECLEEMSGGRSEGGAHAR